MYDVLVIGSGFGGLGCALTLADKGAKVLLCEALRYPGGCASTFTRGGFTFESGATLFSGFDPGQLFHRWIERFSLAVEPIRLDPVVELRAPGLVLQVPPRREALVDAFAALPGAPRERLRDFFAHQRAVADTLWGLFDAPELLPPFTARRLFTHAARLPRYLPLLTLMGKPLMELVERYELHNFSPLVTYLHAVCQITVQASAAEAEAPFALGAMDYYFRGARHIKGGIGALADSLIQAIRARGGEVWMPSRVKSLSRGPRGWVAETRSGPVEARAVAANLLPQDVQKLLAPSVEVSPRLRALGDRVAEGWGAAMLYLTLPKEAPLPEKPFHWELIHDPSRPFQEGNHVFCSASGLLDGPRGPNGERSVTVSTHVPMGEGAPSAATVERIQAAMQATLAARAPELWEARSSLMTASPRTFARFTGRHLGLVGGIPRRAGLQHYEGIFPAPVAPDLYLLGDTVFPGQSTLATAIGGQKVAEQILGRR